MKLLPILSILFATLFTTTSLIAHCQVPCGIYGDELKFNELEQHIETIHKAGAQIRSISSKSPLSAQEQQQLIRWTTNKEDHAQKIIDEVAHYFLAQRIALEADHYEEKIELLHHIIVYAMKSKQSTESEPNQILSTKLSTFKELYLGQGKTH